VPSGEASNLKRYAELFNARDWDGLRALLAEEARLDLVSRWQRHGASAGHYFGRYAELADLESMRAEPGLVDGIAVLAISRTAATAPSVYFVRLSWNEGRVTLIRDFRYVPYIAEGVRFRAATV
jgi:RNA polymerase sigma-70 factor (ECF subfamily)